MRIQQDEVRTHHATGEYVNPTAWDKKAQRVKGNSEEAEAINGKMDALKARALKITNELLLSGEPFNPFTLKDRLVNGLTKAVTFDDVMNEYLEKMKSLKGKSYAQPTIIKYKNSQLRVSQYVKKRFKRNHIYLYELDYDFIDGFETFLKVEFNNSNTTCAKHFQRISRVVWISRCN